jgi:hypothetical protein
MQRLTQESHDLLTTKNRSGVTRIADYDLAQGRANRKNSHSNVNTLSKMSIRSRMNNHYFNCAIIAYYAIVCIYVYRIE